MSFLELFLLAIALSMDALAIAVCFGLSLPQTALKKMLTIGLYFGFFQAAMPLIGYLAAKQFAAYIISYDHWIAFVLLCFIGGKMIWESRKKEGSAGWECPFEICDDSCCPHKKSSDCPNASLKPARMLPLAIATSIDALAVGISFAFLRVEIVSTALFIGAITFIISIIGVKIGKRFGKRYRAQAELAGGIVLVLIGARILLTHLL